jgi:adenosylcobinamide amidohydrolase
MMKTKILSPNIGLEHSQDHVRITFNTPCPVLSSAVLNGGWTTADAVLNLKVPKHPENPHGALAPPEETLARYCDQNGWKGVTVGMMTAASMNSLRLARERFGRIEITALVTSGLSNPMRAGDPAHPRIVDDTAFKPGTINTVIATSSPMTAAAMVEAVMIAAEAKAAALQASGVRSRVSQAIATGTGTDAIALACGAGSPRIRYCGKHTLFGEVLARLVIQATVTSIAWESPARGRVA